MAASPASSRTPVPDGTAYQLTLLSGSSCNDPAATVLNPTPTSITTNPNGIAAFALNFPSLAEGTYVRAQVSLPGGPPSPFSNCVRAEPNNTSWPTATLLTPDGSGNASASGYLQNQGEARWFKVPILPNGRIDISLTNLPADYDLIAFSDIGAAYNALMGGASSTTGPVAGVDRPREAGRKRAERRLQHVAVQRLRLGPDELESDPEHGRLQPLAVEPVAVEPVPVERLPVGPVAVEPLPVVSLAVEPVAVVLRRSGARRSGLRRSGAPRSGAAPSRTIRRSSRARRRRACWPSRPAPGTADEHISVNTWNNTGFVYIRIQGKNGAFDPSNPFSLSVSADGHRVPGRRRPGQHARSRPPATSAPSSSPTALG